MLMLFVLLEVKLLQHTLIEDKGLVVADQDGDKASEYCGVTTDVRQNAVKVGCDPYMGDLLLAL